MGLFKRRQPAAPPPVSSRPEKIDEAAFWAQKAELERLQAAEKERENQPENKRGVLDEVGKRHVLQSTSHATGGVMLVGVWYAALRQLDYLGADGFFRDEYVVAAHSWLLSAIVAYVHKRQSGDS